MTEGTKRAIEKVGDAAIFLSGMCAGVLLIVILGVCTLYMEEHYNAERSDGSNTETRQIDEGNALLRI